MNQIPLATPPSDRRADRAPGVGDGPVRGGRFVSRDLNAAVGIELEAAGAEGPG